MLPPAEEDERLRIGERAEAREDVRGRPGGVVARADVELAAADPRAELVGDRRDGRGERDDALDLLDRLALLYDELYPPRER